MQCQCISKLVIYNTVFNATPFTCFVNTKRVDDFNASSSLERGLKNVAQDARRYLQKGTWTGKSKNSVWISSIFRIMWVQFQVSFSAIYGFKRQAIIRWPTYGTCKYTGVATIFQVGGGALRALGFITMCVVCVCVCMCVCVLCVCVCVCARVHGLLQVLWMYLFI